MALQLRQNFNMRMEQKLKLTPQMIQSIEILMLPQMALEERIMSEVESNPVLEVADETSGDASSGEYDGESVAEPAYRDQPETVESHVVDRMSENDQEWLFKPRSQQGSQDEDRPDKMEALASAPERSQSLAQYLVEQLRFQEMSAEVRELAAEICWQLTPRGYLDVPLAELFPEERLEHAEQQD